MITASAAFGDSGTAANLEAGRVSLMRHVIIAAGMLVFGISMAAGNTPAVAGYGALAHDDDTGKYGLSANEVAKPMTWPPKNAVATSVKSCSGRVHGNAVQLQGPPLPGPTM